MASIRMTMEQYEAHMRKMGKAVKPVAAAQEYDGESPAPKTKKPKMSKTELEFSRTYLRLRPHKFQPFTFHMANGLKYRPDFYEPETLTFWEVKGGYRLHSHGRSMLAFNQCRVEFPEFKWRLAMQTKEGWVLK